MTYADDLERAISWCASVVSRNDDPEVLSYDRRESAFLLANSTDIEVVLDAARKYLENIR